DDGKYRLSGPRRIDQLWRRHQRSEPPGGHLRRPGSTRRETGRFAGGAADHFRTARQSQDGQGAGTVDPGILSVARRRGDRMKRREFMTLVGGAAAAWPLGVGAQQPTMPVIGLLGATSPDADADNLRAFRQGLKDAGYVKGENVASVYRYADNQ